MKNLISILLATILCLVFGASDIFAQNIAKGKTARQSSTAWGGVASRALDGNTSGSWSQNSVTHTDYRNDHNQWWEVDLGQVYNIGSIKIYNRTDCCMNRLRDIYILVSENPIYHNNWQDYPISSYYAFHEEFYPGQANPIVHKKEARGRYVRIFRQKGDALSLAEVEIFESQKNTQEQTSVKAQNLSGEYRIKVKATNTFWHENNPGDQLISTRFQTENDQTVFILEKQNDNSYRIRVKANNLYLHYDGWGDKLISTRYQETDDYTRFYFVNQNDGSYRIQSKADGKFLDCDSQGDKLLSTRFQETTNYSRFYLVGQNSSSSDEARKRAEAEEEKKLKEYIEANRKANEDLERFRAGQDRWHEQLASIQAEKEKKRKEAEARKKAEEEKKRKEAEARKKAAEIKKRIPGRYLPMNFYVDNNHDAIRMAFGAGLEKITKFSFKVQNNKVQNNITWYKAIKIFDKSGRMICMLSTQDSDHGPKFSQAFHSDQFGSKVKVEFWKAKTFGDHICVGTKNFNLSDLIGNEIEFMWMND